MITNKRLFLLIFFVCCLEFSIYLWSVWTSTLELDTFFAIQPEYIFDKCARIAGRISSVLLLYILIVVGYFGLKKIYSDEKKKNTFIVLINVFTCNHLIHLLFVLLRFRSHGESILFGGPVEIGGAIHGVITFASIVVMPFILWKFKELSKLLYAVIVFYLFNVSSFIVKTFIGKVDMPDHPAYHNQFGIVIIVAACLYILYSVWMDARPDPHKH